MKRLIESERFPIEVVNEASAREKGPGRPPYWEMVFWWTRKPLASARALILASLLPEDFDVKKFLEMVYPSIRFKGCSKGRSFCFDKTPHYLNPRVDRVVYEKYVTGKSLLDPFAGFGSIPLEAIRLGLSSVYAVELLPTAVVFLRAVLEYPMLFGKRLIVDVEKWGKWVIEQLGRDPDIRELYDDDTVVYIGSWEIKCPYCRRYTPLIGNWWLARIKDNSGGYKKLVWMKPIVEEDEVFIEVVDKTGEASKADEVEALVSKGRTIGVRIHNGETIKEYIVGWEKLHGQPNIDAKRETAYCLHCGAPIKNKILDKETGKQVWYVKHAIRQYNSLLEQYLEGKTSLEQLRQAPARPKILVKVKIKGRDLEFQPATREDTEKLWKALQKLKQIYPDPDIPTEPIPEYETRSIWVTVYGFNKWFKLFNPRQLLTLVKLVKLIRETSKKVEEEKLREGWNKERAQKYVEAVTTYLAIALLKHINYNSVVTSTEPTQKFIRETLAFRGIAMTWNWVEEYPAMNILGSFTRSLSSTINSLSYLVSAVSSGSSGVGVLLDDAMVLGRIGDRLFDVVVTDPAYRDDVPYSELSDFYYVWLKRALSDVGDGGLRPRFHRDVFFDEFGGEVISQWMVFAPREVSFNPGRLEFFGFEKSDRVYREMLARSFRAIASRLKDDGLLVVYFAHSSPEAWESLVYAGRSAGLWVSNAFPIRTESEESVVARGKAAITSSIVVVWRKGVSGELDLSVSEDEVVRELAEFIARARESGVRETTLYVMTYARALGLLSRFERIRVGEKTLSVSDLVVQASRLAARSFVVETGARIWSREAIAYLVFKIASVYRGRGRRRKLPSSDLILLCYGIESIDNLVRKKVIAVSREARGASVAKRKVYELLEPKSDHERDLLDLLHTKRVDSLNPKTIVSSVDMLHILEYYALTKDVRGFIEEYNNLYSMYPDKTLEAIELAKAIVHALPSDHEAFLAKRVLEYLGKTSGRVYRETSSVALMDKPSSTLDKWFIR